MPNVFICIESELHMYVKANKLYYAIIYLLVVILDECSLQDMQDDT